MIDFLTWLEGRNDYAKTGTPHYASNKPPDMSLSGAKGVWEGPKTMRRLKARLTKTAQRDKDLATYYQRKQDRLPVGPIGDYTEIE